MLDDELGVIGCCLLGGLATSSEASEKLMPSDFMGDDRREAFLILCRLAGNGDEISPARLEREWSKSQPKPCPTELLTSHDLVPSPHNLPYYLGSLLESSRKRRLTQLGQRLVERGMDDESTADELMAMAEADLFREESRSVETVDGQMASTRFVDDAQKRFDLQGQLPGLPTPWNKLNQKLDGIQFGEQTIVGARPGGGKSAFGVCLASHAAWDLHVPTLFVTLEMSVQALARRLFCARCSVGMGNVRHGTYTEAEFAAMSRFAIELKAAPLWFIESPGSMGVSSLCAAVRRHVRKNKIRLVIVDYLQKLSPDEKNEKRTYEIGAVSGQLVALARSTGIALVTLAQLNREPERTAAGTRSDQPSPGRLPRLSDLADSGQIERDADTVILLHRDKEDESGAAIMYVAKQRDGEVGKVPVVFRGEFCRFEDKPFDSPNYNA